MIVENYRVKVRSGFINIVLAKFPLFEVVLKFIYWQLTPLIPHRIVLRLKRLRSSSVIKTPIDLINLQDLSDFLKNIGIDNGESIVVHSSYDSLKFMNVLPRDVVKMLCNLVGNRGNLMMPVNRIFNPNISPLEFNVNKNKIWSGALPYALFLDKNSVKSKIPINSVVIWGIDAESFVSDELKNDYETPCGITSPWYKLYEKNGLVLGLGVDLVHNLTMTHLVEDTWITDWPSKNWYNDVKYRIIDGDSTRDIVIKQRKEHIGKYFYTESRLAYDLEKNGILRAYNFNGINIQVLESVELVSFLKGKRHRLYPFFCNFLIK